MSAYELRLREVEERQRLRQSEELKMAQRLQAEVRWAWDPKQLPMPHEFHTGAAGAAPPPAPGSGQGTALYEQSPVTPQKPLVETPTKPPEAPKGAEGEEITPPKDLSVHPSRRGHPRPVPTPQNAHAQVALRSKGPSRKGSLPSSKTSAKRNSGAAPAQTVRHQEEEALATQMLAAAAVTASDIDGRLTARNAEAEAGRRAPPGEPAAALESGAPPSRRREREQIALHTARTQSAADNATAAKTVPGLAQEPLLEFSVTAPRCGREAALCSLEKLPTSLRHALLFVRNVPALPCTSLDGNRPLLPPARTDLPPRPTLVLDLDETLVHCSRSSSSRSGPPPAAPDLVVVFDDAPSCGAVAFRPFANLFLEVVARAFEVVVFTASQKSYADKVIDALDPTGTLIEHRLYRPHCTELRGAFFKELGLLGRPLHQCILVDNSPISVACNADNSVLIKSWYGDQLDQELYDLLAILEEMHFHGGGDCGRYLSQRYGLRDFFQGLRESVGHRLP